MRSFIVAVSLLAVACGGSPTEPSGGTATLNIQLTDTPFVDAKAVLVTFNEVSVHRADAEGDGWTTFGSNRTCDLKQLVENATDVLGLGMALTEGHYTQIRLNVVRASLDFDALHAPPACYPGDDHKLSGDDNAPLVISSGRVILNRPFDLTENTSTTILLDFDGDRSIREAPPGSYRMSPVIRVVSVVSVP